MKYTAVYIKSVGYVIVRKDTDVPKSSVITSTVRKEGENYKYKSNPRMRAFFLKDFIKLRDSLKDAENRKFLAEKLGGDPYGLMIPEKWNDKP